MPDRCSHGRCCPGSENELRDLTDDLAEYFYRLGRYLVQDAYIAQKERKLPPYTQENTGNNLSSCLAKSSVLGHLATGITAPFLMTQSVSCYPVSQTLAKFQNQQESALQVVIADS